MTDAFRAGNLRNHSNAWSTIETPLPVIDWINSGFRLHFSKDPEGFVLPNHLLSAKQEAFVDREIHDLFTSGTIEECLGQPHCVSPIVCVPKKNKMFRLIVDLRRLNSVSETPKFQYESISMVCDQVRPHDTLVTLDIKNGFHHIAVHSDHRKFLGIHWKGQWYQWTVLPFGFNGSPYFFLQNATAGNSASTSTRFATRCLRGRYFTYGSSVRDREPQAAFTGHVNAFRMANQLGKVVPSVRPSQRIHRLRCGHRERGRLSHDQRSCKSHPTTKARYQAHSGAVNRYRTGTSTHNRAVHRDDKNHHPWKATSTKRLSSAQSSIKLELPARTRQPHEGRPNLVVSRTGVLERSPDQNEAGRSSASYRRTTNGMGRSS